MEESTPALKAENEAMFVPHFALNKALLFSFPYVLIVQEGHNTIFRECHFK